MQRNADVDVVAKILAQFYERVVGPLPDIVRPPSAPAGGMYVDTAATAATGADDGGGVGLGGMMSSSRLSNGEAVHCIATTRMSIRST